MVDLCGCHGSGSFVGMQGFVLWCVLVLVFFARCGRFLSLFLLDLDVVC